MIKNKNILGFTMLELIVVIAMLAIVTAVSSPRIFKTLYRSRLRSEANTLLSTIVYCQGMAAIQRATFVIHFNIDNQEYYVERMASKSDDFDLTADDLTSEGSSLFPGESRNYLPDDSTDEDDKPDYLLDDEDNAITNRNAPGKIEIFDEKTHKLPENIKILKILDGRGEEYQDGTIDLPLDPQGRSIDTTIVLGKSENSIKYKIHIGANGLTDITVEDEDEN